MERLRDLMFYSDLDHDVKQSKVSIRNDINLSQVDSKQLKSSIHLLTLSSVKHIANKWDWPYKYLKPLHFFHYPSIEYLICKVKLIRSPEIQVQNDPLLIIIWKISYFQYNMDHIILTMIWSGTYGIEIQDISEVKFKSWSLLVLYVTRGTPEHQAHP